MNNYRISTQFAALLICGLCILMISCDDDDRPNDQELGAVKIESWRLSSDTITRTASIVHNGQSELELNLETNSLCPNSGVLVEILSGNAILFMDTIADFEREEIRLQVPQGINLTINTSIVIKNDLIICVWLGVVEVELSYVE